MRWAAGLAFGAFWISSSVMVAARPSTCAGARSNARRRSPARSSRAVTNLRRMGTAGSAMPTSRITRPRRPSCKRRTKLIERATGERPLGFYSMWAPSLNTRRIYKSSASSTNFNAYNGHDLPYYGVRLPGGPMLVVPYALDSNDFKFIAGDPGAPRRPISITCAARSISCSTKASGESRRC